ncbi:hypothetical protein EU537_06410 [Candidatus Thorarchaeota archaeon]|nr:MAG: hypothetical protein EU537_06410 [Candidatus Thorarchaeota archaeon]
MKENTNDSQRIESEESDIDLFATLQIDGMEMFAWTIVYGFLGAVLYMLVSLIPMPYTMVSLFKFGLLPSISIVAITGAIRGPLAGFLSGYIGVLIYDWISYGLVVTLTLPAMAFGVTGFVVGMASYRFDTGRSLAKLSVLSMIGFVFTTLLVVVIGLIVEGYATMAAIGFVMLPMLTLGLPSAFLLPPILAAGWQVITSKIIPSAIPER